MKKNDTVLVAMSGGVDSAVALLKIIEMGYNAVGVTMKLWEYNSVGGNTLNENNCCAIESINNAKLVCERLGVPHYTIDFTEDFENKVINNFVDEYLAGRTPNPCVRCNSYVKWDTFINQADKLGAKYIATGHYANISKVNEENKITYLNASCLSRILAALIFVFKANENMKTVILPIDAATIPLPPSKKPKALP